MRGREYLDYLQHKVREMVLSPKIRENVEATKIYRGTGLEGEFICLAERDFHKTTEGNKVEVPIHPTGDYLTDQAA
jgi:hypothetical protein